MRGSAIARRWSNSIHDNNSLEGFALRPAAFTFARRICLIGAFACLASLATAFAAEPKPDAAIKNKTVDASVFLDNKIKADPALSADCLARAKDGSA